MEYLLDYIYGFIAVILGGLSVFFFNRKAIEKESKKEREDEIQGVDRLDSIEPDLEEIPEDIVLPDPEPEPIEEDIPEIYNEFGKICWIIDPGHGPKTAGKRSPLLPDGRQLLEYEFNRDIKNRIIQKARSFGFVVVDLLPDQTGLGNYLTGRVDRANSIVSDLPRIFVSIHANAATVDNPKTDWEPRAEGVEVWHFHRSEAGFAVASIFSEEISKGTGWKDRGPKSRSTRQFYVLRATKMTSILTENGFYNNPNEVKELLNDNFRDRIAEAHVAAMARVERGQILS